MMLPGDFATVRTNGLGGLLIRVVTRAKVNHAMVYVGDGFVVEAESRGAVKSPVSEYPADTLHWSSLPLTDAERDKIVTAALSHLGAPYSWVDDACIALARIFGVHVPEWVRRRLEGTDHLMCSQLVDVSYHEAGIELFADGRLPGDVAPGDLDLLIDAEDRAKAGA